MILLTGATGFVGRAVLARLTESPSETRKIRCAVRAKSPLFEENIRNIDYCNVGNFDAQTDWSQALTGVTHVIHCAARVHVMHETASDPLAQFRRVNVDMSMQLARQAALAGVRQFIYISSVKVNGEITMPGTSYSEISDPRPEDAYGISKFEAEQALLAYAKESGMSVTIIRPPLVYGPGVKANFLTMLHWVKKEIPLPFASIDNRRSFVYVKNLADLIVRCIDHPNAKNDLFLASDDDDISTAELMRRCANALDVPSRSFPFPVSALIFLSKLIGRKAISDRLCLSLQVDISKSKSQLQWRPPYTMQEGLRATAISIKSTQAKQ